MTVAARITDMQDRLSAFRPAEKPWRVHYLQDVPWLLGQLAAQTAEVERLTAKLEGNECNAGHKTLPLKLWDCPACGIERLAVRDAALAAAAGLVQAWKVRLAYIGHPREPKHEGGAPDWSEIVMVTDAFLSTPAAEWGRALLGAVEALREISRAKATGSGLAVITLMGLVRRATNALAAYDHPGR